MTQKWIFFQGTTPTKEEEQFVAHGIKFTEKGKVYPVSDAVFEYLKAIRGFIPCRGIGAKEPVDFPVKKEPAVAKSFEDKWKKGKK